MAKPLKQRKRQVFRPAASPPGSEIRKVFVLDPVSYKGRRGIVPGGAATVLDLSPDPSRELRSLANEGVFVIMAATYERP
jgi:hypothetical protein